MTTTEHIEKIAEKHIEKIYCFLLPEEDWDIGGEDYQDVSGQMKQAIQEALAPVVKENEIITADRNGVMKINKKHRETIDQLRAELAEAKIALGRIARFGQMHGEGFMEMENRRFIPSPEAQIAKQALTAMKGEV